MTSTSGVVAIQKKTRAAAAPEHFATLQPAQKTEFKLQTQRRNHADSRQHPTSSSPDS